MFWGVIKFNHQLPEQIGAQMVIDVTVCTSDIRWTVLSGHEVNICTPDVVPIEEQRGLGIL